MTNQQRVQPSTEDEWIIHSINIHGVFFERWCQKKISDTPPWLVKSTNYPVEFPPPNGPLRGKESALDIRAEVRQGDLLFTLVIECKKNNPDFVKWVFFPKSSQPSYRIPVAQISQSPSEGESSGDRFASMRGPVLTTTILTDEARETRGDYQNYRKG